MLLIKPHTKALRHEGNKKLLCFSALVRCSSFLCLVFIALSLTVCDDGNNNGGVSVLTYEKIDGGTAYSVTGCDKSATEVIVPAKYKGLPVTSIGNRAFFQCGNLISVSISEGVTSLDMFAFSDCSSLISITLPASLTEIGNAAFRNCTSLTSLSIPEGVSTIGDYAFDYCRNITSITIPASVTSIGPNAFYQWTNEQTIYIQGYASEAAADAAWGDSSWRSTDGTTFIYQGS